MCQGAPLPEQLEFGVRPPRRASERRNVDNNRDTTGILGERNPGSITITESNEIVHGKTQDEWNKGIAEYDTARTDDVIVGKVVSTVDWARMRQPCDRWKEMLTHISPSMLLALSL